MELKQNNWHTTRNWHKSLTKADAEQAYTVEGRSMPELAKLWSTSEASVRRFLVKHGIVSRNYKEAGSLHFGRRDPILTESQRQLILGSMLGDACWGVGMMRYRDGSEHNTLKVHFYHTEKKLAYVEHKRDLLGCGVRINQKLKLSRRISGKGAVMRGFAFSATRTLQPLLALIDHPKKVSRTWLDQLTWEGLAYWYQDDGSLRVQGRLGSVLFYTNGFTYEEHEIMRDWFQEVHGMHFNISKSPNNTPDEWVLIAHRQRDVYKFLTNVRPFIVPCMQHKIRTWKSTFRPSRAEVKKLN